MSKTTQEGTGGNVDTVNRNITTPTEPTDEKKPSTPTGAGLSELGAKLKKKAPELSDDDIEKRVKEVQGATETLKNGRKGIAGKAQNTALNLIFGRGGNMRSLAGKLFRSKKDTVDASKIVSQFKSDFGREDGSSGTGGTAISKQISDELNELSDQVDDLNESVMDLITKNDRHDRISTESLSRISDSIEVVKERMSPKDVIEKSPEEAVVAVRHHAPEAKHDDREHLHSAVKGMFGSLSKKQISELLRNAAGTTDEDVMKSVIKSGGSFESLEKRELPKEDHKEEPKAERVPEKAVDSEIASATTHTEAHSEDKNKETGGSINRKLDRILSILKTMKGKRGKGESGNREDRSERKSKKGGGFKATDLIFGKKLGAQVRGLIGKKKEASTEPEKREGGLSDMLKKKLLPKMPGAEGLEGAGAGEAAGMATKSVGGVGLAVAGGALIAGIGGHFINKGLKAVGMQDALDSGSFEKAGRDSTATNKFEGSQARLVGKLEGTGYTLVGPGKYKDSTGNIVDRNDLPEDVQKKLPGGVMEKSGEITSTASKSSGGQRNVSETVAPERRDVGAEVTPPKTERMPDGEKRSLIVSREKPIIVNGGGGSGKKAPVILVTRNMEQSVSTYTASIFDHPVVHPGIYKM